MLMHERVHRRAAEIPDALRKAVHRGGVCESCDDLVMNAVTTAASVVGAKGIAVLPLFPIFGDCAVIMDDTLIVKKAELLSDLGSAHGELCIHR